MRYLAKIEVSLKPGHSDPEGEMTQQALTDLTFPVKRVRVSKLYEIILETMSRERMVKQLDEMCRKLLANPTKDDYRFTVEEAE
jgi:phosphoribosylformylglycinamidine synthase